MDASEHQLFPNLEFGKQFLIAPDGFTHTILANWATTPISPSLRLHSHPAANLASAKAHGVALHGLGTLLDPTHPERDDVAILSSLITFTSTFEQLESALSSLGGRWVLVATFRGESRIYHDATGLKPIFFSFGPSSGFYAGSQPSLLCALGLTERDEGLVRSFESQKNSGSWPINVVPYSNVKQVLPNHYLNLVNGSIHRYWPTTDFPGRSLEEAVEEMLPILRGLVSSAHARSDCVMNLTGGYDSRLLLAAAKPFWSKTEFFTIKRNDSPHHDISIPKHLSRKFEVKHTFVAAENDAGHSSSPTNQELIQTLLPNVGGMFYDNAIQAIKAEYATSVRKFLLQGLVSEVMRCFYYSDGIHPKHLNGTEIARRAGFSGNPIAAQGFSEWQASLPSGLPITTLDLLYWEHRLGVWASCGLSCREAITDHIPPMNCRVFLEVGLSASVENRKAPYALIRELIRVAEPKLLSIEFNHDWVDAWGSQLRMLPIPWRLKRRLHWV